VEMRLVVLSAALFVVLVAAITPPNAFPDLPQNNAQLKPTDEFRFASTSVGQGGVESTEAWLQLVFDQLVKVTVQQAEQNSVAFDGMAFTQHDRNTIVSDAAYALYHSYKTNEDRSTLATAFAQGLAKHIDGKYTGAQCKFQYAQGGYSDCGKWLTTFQKANPAENPWKTETDDFFYSQNGASNLACRFGLSVKSSDRGDVFGCLLKSLVEPKTCDVKTSLFAPNQGDHGNPTLMLADSFVVYFKCKQRDAVLKEVQTCLKGHVDDNHFPYIMDKVEAGIFEGDDPLSGSFGTSRGKVAGLAAVRWDALDKRHIGKNFKGFKSLFYDQLQICGFEKDKPWKNTPNANPPSSCNA